jgi:hypothetical protein
MASSEGSSGGIGFLGALTLIFITLKLTGHIDWSWWWVLSPLYLPVALIVAMILCVGASALTISVVSAYIEHRKDAAIERERKEEAKKLLDDAKNISRGWNDGQDPFGPKDDDSSNWNA